MHPAFPKIAVALLVAFALEVAAPAQKADSVPDRLEGTVINSVTREPVGRALVFSPDQRFATMTDDRGHFEFVRPSPVASPRGASDNSALAEPSVLLARKPGYLQQGNGRPQFIAPNDHDVTLELIPEAKIVGHVVISKSEVQERVQVQIFKKQVEDGRAHWIPAGETTTRSDGEFRFSELQAGEYRALTHETLDRDPQDFVPNGQTYGYPPVYFPAAPDFEASAILQLTPGRTQDIEIKLVKQPYYRVHIPVEDGPANGMQVRVSPNGSNSPGFSLGYSPQEQAITGLLPSGTYTVHASSFNPQLDGTTIFTVHGADFRGAPFSMAPSRSIPVQVVADLHIEPPQQPFNPPGPRAPGSRTPIAYRVSYISNITLQSDDNQLGAWLRQPQHGDEPLLIENVRPGRYWVQVMQSTGYVASVTSGGIDLLRKPLVVAVGVPSSPIEITLRDGGAQIQGSIEGSPDARNPNASATGNDFLPYAHVYCIPSDDSAGQYAEVPVSPTGRFDSQTLVPGVYRIIAVKGEIHDLEYRNPEALRAFDSKGIVVRLVEGQTEKLTLPLVDLAR